MGSRATTHTVTTAMLLAACAQPAPPPAAESTSGAEPAPVTTPVAGTIAPASETAQADSSAAPAPADTGFVSINGVALGAPDFAELQAILGGTPQPGKYWYDAASGLWGIEGHGAGGVTRPGLLPGGAPLAAEASAGTSGAFVNGRQLSAAELTAIATLLDWPLPADSRYSGHYTLDGEGAFNSARGRYLGNLAAAARRTAGSAAPGLAQCILYHLHEPDGLLGREVTVACD